MVQRMLTASEVKGSKVVRSSRVSHGGIVSRAFLLQ